AHRDLHSFPTRRSSDLVSDDLLRAQRNGRGKLRGKRPSFIERVCMQGLRAAHDRSERLNRRTHHVVVGLLRGERTARRLRMETRSEEHTSELQSPYDLV